MKARRLTTAFNAEKTVSDLPVPLLPGLAGYYKGKAKENYDLPGGRRIIISTDRLSLFDKHVTTIPDKGAAQTLITYEAFSKTADICPNHIIAKPDPNILICRKLNMIPVEVVVRAYMAGTSPTSILTMYKAGRRDMYGICFPDGLRPNEKLNAPVVTPTTKAPDGEHDMPISPAEIIRAKIVTATEWDEIQEMVLRLFARGQDIAREKGLILADTKYEFGFDDAGHLILGDEIHTFDSSRYWLAGFYERAFAAGQTPPSLDKESTGIRNFLKAHAGFQATGTVPEIPLNLRQNASQAAIALCRVMTDIDCASTQTKEHILRRITDNLSRYIAGSSPGMDTAPRLMQ